MGVVVGVAGVYVGGAVISFIRGYGLQFRGGLSLGAGSLLPASLGAGILLTVLRALRWVSKGSALT